MKLLAAFLIIPALAFGSDSPFPRFNKPVSMFWWQASCKDAYITNPAEGYAKGYCHGVMVAYMNQLESWCVPDEVTWGEVQDYLAMTVADANIEPLTQPEISGWIANAIQVKWPCPTVDPSGVVTDPELIEKLKRLREEAANSSG